MTQPVFRFAPSPNGKLHLGHAFSALLNFRAAEALSGRLLLRMEDIDVVRCTPEYEAVIVEDLRWLGIGWEEPVLRQSEQFDDYRAALGRLEGLGLVYRAFLTRAEIKRYVADFEAGGDIWPRDPDGAPLYPGDSAVLSEQELTARRKGDAAYALRLDMKAALSRLEKPLSWWEGPADESRARSVGDWNLGHDVVADPAAWGDVVLARKDTPTSYHLAVVVDDARQGITDVVRGKDIFPATSIHRLLQVLLSLPEPRYRHHELMLAENGQKLSKSNFDTSLQSLRASGVSIQDLATKFLNGSYVPG
ncbi:tRNA glutamyl-Q(34) synthetase GluQRS [Labrenzia sp. CE80]|uniref:tRNA glutamyl-Q(34) synthetase GluQRS n=1 Tax=Labrenzia sp. CE80 TaxID=1788986 RepID=UPI00129A9EC5|nr:tRNA glutamyl-Q(34) synthetase GluQRS [Labrenzia sp. CE80]